MATTGQYTIQTFVDDARRVLGAANGDRERVVRELRPLVEQVVWDDGLFDERYRAEPENGRPRYLYHHEPGGALQIYVVEFAPGQPTPVHDHVTWGLIGICGGEQRTTRYARVDDSVEIADSLRAGDGAALVPLVLEVSCGCGSLKREFPVNKYWSCHRNP